jgi:acid phosphatase type 7
LTGGCGSREHAPHEGENPDFDGWFLRPGAGGDVQSLPDRAAQAATFNHFPIAQRATGNEVVLKWSQSSAGATVTYGPVGGATQMVTDPSTSSNRHELKLINLTPSTRYAYTVDVGGGNTASGEFSTAAAAGEAFSFVVYGDNRSNSADHQSVVDAIAKESVDFLVETGDVINYPLQNEYDEYFTIEKELLLHNVLFPALGNHEYALGAGVTVWKQNFYIPDQSYYFFDWGNSRFVVLDFNTGIAAQTTWLGTVLKEARDQNMEHIFIVLHHSPYDSGNHGENKSRQGDWVPLFQQYKVDMIFGGHDHDYERGFVAATGLRYLITGGGGAPLYDIKTTNNTYMEKFEKTLNYVKVSVAGGLVSITALKPDGSVIDDYSFSTQAVAPDMAEAADMAVAPDLSTGGTTTGGSTGGTTGTTGGVTGTTGGATGGTNGATPSNASGGCSTTGAGTSGGIAFFLAFALFFAARRRRA